MFRILRRTILGIVREFVKKFKMPKVFIQKIAVIYVIVWSISPPMEIDMKYRLLALGCVGIFFVLTLSQKVRFRKIHVWAVLFVVAVAWIAYIETQGFSGMLKQIPIYMLAICFLINYCYSNRWTELSGIVPIVLLLLIVYNLKTVQILTDDPTIARLLVRNDESTYQYLRQGIGGYSLIYPQVCIFPALLAWIIQAFRHNFKCFALGGVWLVSYVLYLLKAGYSIAIFASAVGAFILLFHKGKNVFSSFLLAAAIFVGVLLMIIHVDGLRNALLEAFDGTAVAKKINDLVATNTTGEAEGSFAARMIRYTSSLRKIVTYPFIGSLWMESGGGHSAVLDTFAKYGVWGGIMYVKMLYHVPTDYKRRVNHPLICSISNGTLVSMLFVSILDSFTYSFMCMILLVLPLLYEDMMRWAGIKT